MNYPREWASTVDIAADAPLGTHLWRLSSARGGMGGRHFVVGDLPEFIETESNSLPDRAERITLPVTLNGQIEGERDLDYFVFTAAAGDVVTAEVTAARLGSPIETLVEFYDLTGQRLPTEEIRIGSDPVVATRIATAGDYRLVVSNLNFRGGPQFVYRVTVATAPYVKSVFPAGWQVGHPRPFEFSLLTGNRTSQMQTETLTLDASFIGEAWLQRSPLGANAVALAASAHAEVVETEPNAASQPMPLSATPSSGMTFPLTINGRFLTADDEDWFEFTATKGAAFTFECHPAPRSAPTLPVLSLHDANGGPLAIHSAVDHADRKARLDPWVAPADGKYRIRVRDLRHGTAGGPELTYRLTVTPAVPDFALSLASDFINVVQESKTEVDVRLVRKGGFTGPVRLTVRDLPAEVQAAPVEFAPGQDVVKLVVTASAEARPDDRPIQIVGTAEHAGMMLQRIATATHLAHDAEGVGLGSPTVDHVQLTVQHKPVFKLFCNEAYQYAYRGTIYPYLMEIERLNGFNGPITLEMADRQIKDLDGIELVHTVIPPNASQTMLPIFLPETMHINVQAHSNVYSQGYAVFEDKWGQRQSLLVVSTMRCMIRPLPTVARLKSLTAEVACQPNTKVTCRLQLDRTPNFTGPVTIQLIAPTIDEGFSAEPVVLPADQSTVDVIVHVSANPSPSRDTALIFRAVGQMSDNVQMLSQAHIPVRSNTGTKKAFR